MGGLKARRMEKEGPMPTSVVLPDPLTRRLEEKAASQNQSLDEFVLDALEQALEEEDEEPTLEEVVAKIRATPRDPSRFHPATESLAGILSDAPEDPTFDSEEWNREWAKVEAEMKAITRANDRAEGRG